MFRERQSTIINNLLSKRIPKQLPVFTAPPPATALLFSYCTASPRPPPPPNLCAQYRQLKYPITGGKVVVKEGFKPSQDLTREKQASDDDEQAKC